MDLQPIYSEYYPLDLSILNNQLTIMARNLYDCTASELATQSVETLSKDTSNSEAANWFEETGYDAAPVYISEDPIGFVHKDDVSTKEENIAIEESLTPLTIEYIISGDTTFLGMVSALIEKPVYFLGGHRQVDGILTRADLNTTPARIYLFDRITYLEETLRELILDRIPDWKATLNEEDIIKEIEKRYAEAQDANVALEEIHYTQFSTLCTIVSSVKECWVACGFSRERKAKDRLNDIRELRNDVAHANLIVENTDSSGFLNAGRTTENFYEVLESINDVLNSLQAEGYEPENS